MRQLLVSLTAQTYLISDCGTLRKSINKLSELLSEIKVPVGERVHVHRTMVKRHTQNILRKRIETVRRKRQWKRQRQNLKMRNKRGYDNNEGQLHTIDDGNVAVFTFKPQKRACNSTVHYSQHFHRVWHLLVLAFAYNDGSIFAFYTKCIY